SVCSAAKEVEAVRTEDAELAVVRLGGVRTAAGALLAAAPALPAPRPCREAAPIASGVLAPAAVRAVAPAAAATAPAAAAGGGSRLATLPMESARTPRVPAGTPPPSAASDACAIGSNRPAWLARLALMSALLPAGAAAALPPPCPPSSCEAR